MERRVTNVFYWDVIEWVQQHAERVPYHSCLLVLSGSVSSAELPTHLLHCAQCTPVRVDNIQLIQSYVA